MRFLKWDLIVQLFGGLWFLVSLLIWFDLMRKSLCHQSISFDNCNLSHYNGKPIKKEWYTYILKSASKLFVEKFNVSQIAHIKYWDFKLQKNEFAKVKKIFSGTRKKFAGEGAGVKTMTHKSSIPLVFNQAKSNISLLRSLIKLFLSYPSIF